MWISREEFRELVTQAARAPLLEEMLEDERTRAAQLLDTVLALKEQGMMVDPTAADEKWERYVMDEPNEEKRPRLVERPDTRGLESLEEARVAQADRELMYRIDEDLSADR
jgi:hypothetical protein